MKHIEITNRPEFAAYLNMAMHNCYMVMKHVATLTGCDMDVINNDGKKFDQETIKDACMLDLSYLPVEYEKNEKLKQLYLQFFPMLDPFAKKEGSVIAEGKKVQNNGERNNNAPRPIPFEVLYPYGIECLSITLRKVLTVLTFYRDMASHVVFNDARDTSDEYGEIESSVAAMLNFTMTVACRNVKNKFSLQGKRLEFFTKDRYDGKLANTGFYHSIYRNEGKKNGKYVMESLSETGLVYLICMFLERKYARKFLDLMPNDFYSVCDSQPNSTPSQIVENRRLLFEIYHAYHIQLPRTKLDSTQKDVANAMDMLNELKKCPSELYDVLDRNYQQKFEVTSSEGETVLLRRHGDRFANLALRWLDDMGVFNKLRFQVQYGKYHYVLCDNKHCVDGNDRVRTIVKNLNGFGKLTEVEARRKGALNVWSEHPEVWNGNELIREFVNFQVDKPGMKPYITDMRTRYIIDGNKVGIYCGNYMPNIGAENVISNKMPHCWLSVYALPGMVFYSLLYEEFKKREKISKKVLLPEDVVLKYMEKYNQMLSDFKEGKLFDVCTENEEEGKDAVDILCSVYMIERKNIPQKIKDIVLGRQRRDFFKSANETLKEELKISQKLFGRLELDINTVSSKRYNKNMGKNGYVDIRQGKIADALIRDIVKYQPYVLPSDKPTGLNYRVAQSQLASFASAGQLDEIRMTLKKLGLIECENKHPFLEKVLCNNPANVIHMYLFYLKEKCAYLSNSYNEQEECFAKEFILNVPFLHPSQSKWHYMEKENWAKLANSYMEMPLELPDNLYEKPIKTILRHLYYNEMSELVQKNLCNTSYMIQQYMKLVRKDDCQSFYHYPHEVYPLFDEKHMGRVYEEKELDRKKMGIQKRAKIVWNNKKDKDKCKWCKEHPGVWFSEVFEEKVIHAINVFKNTERTIRHYQIQDMLLFLMANDILVSNNVDVKDYFLKDITSDGNVGILSKVVPEVKISFKLLCDVEDENISTKNNPVFNKVEYDVKIIYKDIKIKDWSKMVSLLYDWRIQNPRNSLLLLLFPYEEGTTVYDVELDFSELEKEFSMYDLNRVELFGLILDFEGELLDRLKNNSEKWDKLSKSRADFKAILDTYRSRESKESKCLGDIRNSIVHNQYVASYTYKNCSTVDDAQCKSLSVIERVKLGFDENKKNYLAGHFTDVKK